ncbi:MAG: hypothetical protein VKP72_04370 [bacterium]|nr:hypothetical protein [bacterium]
MLEPLLAWCTRRLMKPFHEDWIRFAAPGCGPLPVVRPFDLDARRFLASGEPWCIPVIPFMSGGQSHEVLEGVMRQLRAHPVLEELIGTVLILSRVLHDSETGDLLRQHCRATRDGQLVASTATLRKILRRHLTHRHDRLEWGWMAQIEALEPEEVETLVEAIGQLPVTGRGAAFDPVLAWLSVTTSRHVA